MSALEALAAQGYPLFLPWSRERIAIGSGFDSRFLTSDCSPWTSSVAFSTGEDLACVLEQDGGVASFREGHSSSSARHSEHLSASLGVTVGCKFLNANVTGSYDKSTSSTIAGTRISKNASCRMGVVRFKTDPPLNSRARQVLKFSKEKFQETFGDYYVAGYQLGGDAGACLTIAHFDQSQEEQSRITATIKVLWVKKSVTTATTTKTQLSQDFISFCGYDTLQQRNDNIHGNELWRIQQVSSDCMERIDNLQAAVTKKLLDLGCDLDGETSFNTCTNLCDAGVVVQLILVPYARLAEYMVLTSSWNP